MLRSGIVCVGLMLMAANSAQADCTSRVSQARAEVEMALDARVSEGQWQRLSEVLAGLCAPRVAGDSVAVRQDGETSRKAISTHGLNPQKPPVTPVPVPPILGVDLGGDNY